MGKSLELVANEQLAYIGLMNKLKQEFPAKYIENFHQLTLNLQGLSSNKFLLIGESFDETAMLPYLQTINNSVTLFAVYVNKIILCYLFKDFPQAIDNALLALEQIASGIGLMTLAVCNFYYSLSLLANYTNVEPTEQQQYLIQVEENQQKMQHWAHYAPFNYQHKYDLVEAEKARISGNILKAQDYYDRAITGAKNNGYIQEEALANELAGEFYLAIGREKVAKTYMTEAYYGYIRWGATAKVQDLDERYPQLIFRTLNPEGSDLETTRHTISTRSTNSKSQGSTILDLSSVMKAAQALTGEFALEGLLSKLMTILMENAGAQTGYLILRENHQLTRELQSAQKQIIAKEKLASLGALAAGVAHELRNPLNFVNNFAESSVQLTEELIEEIENNSNKLGTESIGNIKYILEELKGNASDINLHGKRAESIIRSMMMHARTESGESQPTDLNEILGQAVDLAYHSKRAKDNRFNLTIETNYDRAIDQLELIASDLSRAFINLIDNACYAVHTKKQQLGDSFIPTLKVTTQNRGDTVEIRISDNGIGIAPEVQDKIFNPFTTN